MLCLKEYLIVRYHTFQKLRWTKKGRSAWKCMKGISGCLLKPLPLHHPYLPTPTTMIFILSWNTLRTVWQSPHSSPEFWGFGGRATRWVWCLLVPVPSHRSSSRPDRHLPIGGLHIQAHLFELGSRLPPDRRHPAHEPGNSCLIFIYYHKGPICDVCIHNPLVFRDRIHLKVC